MKFSDKCCLFIVIIIILFYVHIELYKPQTPIDSFCVLIYYIFWILLLWYIIEHLNCVESFHFEVSPWKRTCLNNDPLRSSKCCCKGFYGLSRNFEYSSDADRLKCSGQPTIPIANNQQPNNYESLDDVYTMNNNMCIDKYKTQYKDQYSFPQCSNQNSQQTIEQYNHNAYRGLGDF
jgi:hypothetical protein